MCVMGVSFRIELMSGVSLWYMGGYRKDTWFGPKAISAVVMVLVMVVVVDVVHEHGQIVPWGKPQGIC